MLWAGKHCNFSSISSCPRCFDVCRSTVFGSASLGKGFDALFHWSAMKDFTH